MNSLPEKSLCYGCRACVGTCPQKALSMAEDAEGFLYPCMDQEKCNNCGKCCNICPSFNNQFKPRRSKVKRRVAVRSNACAQGNTSGGAFAAFAHKFLLQDGFVAGAVYDSEWKVEHIISNKTDDINRMRGSKYLQSDNNNTYIETKSLLENNKKVLFSGTPCQIAGLYGFLGKDYKNLITVDLICHGVNSPLIWKKYLNELELAEGSKIIQEIFTENVFLKGFLINLSLRPCCGYCKYSGRERPSDITIGDFWSQEAEEDRKKGISQILINSEKGQHFFDSFDENWSKKYEIDLDETKQSAPNINSISHNHHPERERFFDLIQIMPYKKALDYAINKKYEIAIIGMHNANYGNLLTTYALYKVISDMGKTVLMLDRPQTSTNKPSKECFNIFRKNPYPDYVLSDIYPDKISMKELNDRIDIFMLPSDQILCPGAVLAYDKYPLLDWVRDDKPKISYSSSFSMTLFNLDDIFKAEMCYFLNKFDFISVREDSGIIFAKENFGLDVEQVLDPVFICPPDIFIEMAEKNKTRIPIEPFLGIYIVQPTDQKGVLIDNIQRSLQIKNSCTIISAAYSVAYGRTLWKRDFLEKAYVEEFLACVHDCEYFITDSFHGLCFSIIFRKLFIVLCIGEYQLNMKTRIYDLLKKINLEERIFISLDNDKEIISILQKKINYDEVYTVLNSEIIRSMAWLNNTLNNVFSIKEKLVGDIIDKKIHILKNRIKYIGKRSINIWLIRKTKGFIRNLRKSGLKYTMILFFKKSKIFIMKK
jgi:coenzyme F420-reducing hydrogenase beta subunit